MTDVPPSPTTRWRAVVRVLRSPLDSLSCTLLPASCSLCGSPLPRLSLVPICDVCWTEFPLQTLPVCQRCGDALPVAPATGYSALCRACRMAPPPFVRAVSYGVYQGRMREAIHALKYDRLHGVSTGLGRMLAEAIAQLAAEAPAGDAGDSGAAASPQSTRSADSTSRVRLPPQPWASCARAIPQWRLTLASSTLLRQRATESQAGLTPRQRRHQCARRIRGFRSCARDGAARFDRR